MSDVGYYSLHVAVKFPALSMSSGHDVELWWCRGDGKTKCSNTFSGYECVCGSGYISHTDDKGHEQCLNINECVSTEAAALDPKCTCERCACKDTKGGYECVSHSGYFP